MYHTSTIRHFKLSRMTNYYDYGYPILINGGVKGFN